MDSSKRKNKLVKYITLAALAIAIALGIHLLDNSTVEADVAWAWVVDDILNAKTATFDISSDGAPTMKNIVDGQYRKQIIGNGYESIIDHNTGQILILKPAEKTAYFIKSAGMKHYSTNSFQYLKDKINILKRSPDTKALPLGTKNINDRPAQGLHIYNTNIDLKIWTDLENNLPALVTYDKVAGLTSFEMSNFKFNVPVEDLALTMNVPQGYKLELMDTDFANPSEQDLIIALNIWANTYLDGHFPEELNSSTLISQTKIINRKDKELRPTKKEKLEMSMQIVRGLLFIRNLTSRSDWEYTGTGATTSDTDTIIFRYKPENSKTYRLIYANLAVEDATINN